MKFNDSGSGNVNPLRNYRSSHGNVDYDDDDTDSLYSSTSASTANETKSRLKKGRRKYLRRLVGGLGRSKTTGSAGNGPTGNGAVAVASSIPSISQTPLTPPIEKPTKRRTLTESLFLPMLGKLDGSSEKKKDLRGAVSLPHDFDFQSPEKRINETVLAGLPSDASDTSLSIDQVKEPQRKSMFRRDNVDAMNLTMGLDEQSADFLDWLLKAKCRDWLRSLSRRDPRACIKSFFDDVARDGADSMDDPEGKGFHPELLSPLLSMFQRSSVFSVWRPTSIDSIRKMMTGQGTGKGLEIKGKSAKKGKLSAYVPFMQIHDENHKKKIRTLPKDGRMRVFYRKQVARDKAHKILASVLEDMVRTVAEAHMSLIDNKDNSCSVPNDHEDEVGIHAIFQNRDELSEEAEGHLLTIEEWGIDNPSIFLIDDYAPKCYGLDLPKRLFWEGYIMRSKDISREPGSMYDTGRPSRPSFQDMNFASIKNHHDEDSPRVVVWQYTDPYLPPSEPDPDPMLPQTLLMAYEEHGRVLPVVSDFDCFLLGTRGIRFRKPLPADQVELLHNVVDDIAGILERSDEGECKNWTSSWLDVMISRGGHHPMPKYGYGDPKSYAIMKHAVQRLEEFGAVRHGAECFNYHFPQELDDEYLVIGGNIEGAKYKYMKLHELQDFLLQSIEQGFTFPLNPKWVLCDNGWKTIWDKLLDSKHPNVSSSIDAWYPPESGLRERIEEIHLRHPHGFQSESCSRKKGTSAWDEAEMALERYYRLQRAKRKLRGVLCWISFVKDSQKRVRSRKEHVVESKMIEQKTSQPSSEKIYDQNGDEYDYSTFRAASGKKLRGLNGRMEGKNLTQHLNEHERETSPNSKQDNKHNSSVSFKDNGNVEHSARAVKTNRMDRGSMEEVDQVSNSSNQIREHQLTKPETKDQVINMAAIGSQHTKVHIEDEDSITDVSQMHKSDSSFPAWDSSPSLFGGGWEQGIQIIDSILNCNSSSLPETQLAGLHRIRDLLLNKTLECQQQTNQRFGRRHTASEGCMRSCRRNEDIPMFIAKEFGGAQTQSKSKFKAQVNKIIAAQRLMSKSNTNREPRNGNDPFLPIEWIRLDQQAKEFLASNLTFRSLANWEFDVIKLSSVCNGSPLLFLGWALLASPHAQRAMASDLGLNFDTDDEGYNFITTFNVKPPIVCAFLRAIESDYLQNPYHNNIHAADVLQTLNTMLQLGGNEFAQSPLEIFSILVAAVIHDVKHPGLNNNFQINSRSELAIQYNDVSVLENLSVSWFFSRIVGPNRDCTVDIFSGLSREQFLTARSIIVKSVLETDMTHHFSLMKTIGVHQARLKGKSAKEWLVPYASDGVRYDPSTDMLCFLLHQADISNPAKPFPLFVIWADRIMAESHAQGDKEASLALPISPLCDRLTADKKQSQIGFIKFVVQPSYELLGEIIPKFAQVVFPFIETNLSFWEGYESDDDSDK